ncbi:hypothetical protein L288_14725 [Sphingobium quisquiliarum P25]|uniref:Uncharacterized protein n=1 Tax=Sphingobium quisquiliarum P25 TaxID=1329909 RepID=T0GIE2_9SPHN|nr:MULTISPECIES: hypothetical protein [Sphingobium]EQB03511.1 hypothetical protein L288_14725 [Sphingobium quisquiliarum P25]EZP71102.1 hypothetical protein BV96_02940 [Sphingomonas paucimobilis]
MNSITELLDKARELAVSNDKIREIIHQREGNWRLELVRQRRRLITLICDLEMLLSRALANPAAPGEVRDMKEALFHMRTILAHHQASWPAATLDTGIEDYLLSANHVRERFLTFAAHVEKLSARFRT